MYCAYDENKNIIAYHDNEDVVNNYITNVYKSNKLVLTAGKLKKKSLYLLDGLDDLYLVRFGETYIQSGYLLYMQIEAQQLLYDETYAKDVLYRLIETHDMKSKNVKCIMNTIEILEDIIYDDSSFTPTLKNLQNMKTNYEAYFYSMGLPGCPKI